MCLGSIQGHLFSREIPLSVVLSCFNKGKKGKRGHSGGHV